VSAPRAGHGYQPARASVHPRFAFIGASFRWARDRSRPRGACGGRIADPAPSLERWRLGRPAAAWAGFAGSDDERRTRINPHHDPRPAGRAERSALVRSGWAIQASHPAGGMRSASIRSVIGRTHAIIGSMHAAVRQGKCPSGGVAGHCRRILPLPFPHEQALNAGWFRLSIVLLRPTSPPAAQWGLEGR
jgi:hypothetical protein